MSCFRRRKFALYKKSWLKRLIQFVWQKHFIHKISLFSVTLCSNNSEGWKLTFDIYTAQNLNTH